MALKIYFTDDLNLLDDIMLDVEKAFETVVLSGTFEEKQLIKLIESGEYLDNTSFIDRFGHKLYLSELSTGCKAGLCVNYFKNRVISLKECGLNARDVIINVLKDGGVLLEDNYITYVKYCDSIAVEVDGHLFTDIDRLNKYINSERPYGIEK